MSNSQPSLQITKMQGAGNSFLIASDKIEIKFQSIMAKNLCDVSFGIGADGMVFLNLENENEFEWNFYNSDGSQAEFCGNAARCVALYISEKFPQLSKIKIKTLAGLIRCELKSQKVVQIEMPKIEWYEKEKATPFWPTPVAWLNTGVPHIVIELSSSDNLRKNKLEAAQIRNWDQLGPLGSNVTFLSVHSSNLISAITYERGVENYTLACGTGAVAAAIFIMEKNSTSECRVQMPGGNLDITSVNGKVFMSGEAHKIAEININRENYEKS